MNDQTYMAERVDDQFNWLNAKSQYHHSRFTRLRTLILVTSALIPLFSGFISDADAMGQAFKWAVGMGGVIVAVSQGLLSLNKHQELWMQYRATAEAIKREKLLYLAKVGAYADQSQAFEQFVAQIEAILADENKRWLENIKNKEEKG
ncbi:MAG: DUF4231 domain-containing protein [Saprospiraceae bacterium]|nr:DUF4231 domain-containing protein [Saprospiraceae bacterium]